MGQPKPLIGPSEVSARIAYFCIDADLRPTDLADVCRVTRGTVSFWLNDKTQPGHEMLATIAQACGRTLADFWADDIDLPSRAEIDRWLAEPRRRAV